MSEIRPTLDLRLVPAAALGWLACGLATGSSASIVVLLGAVALAGVAAVVLLAAAAERRVRRAPVPTRAGVPTAPWVPTPGGVPTSAGVPVGTGAVGTAWLTLGAVAVLLASCAGQLHLRDAGLLAVLVEDRATVELVGVVRAEAAPLRSPARSGGPTHRTVLAVEQLTGRGHTGDAAARVLVLGDETWSGVAYGSRVVVGGRLSAARPGEEVRGVLIARRVDVLSPPGPVDAAVNRLRAGLLAVTEGLPPDPRGLVPGAAVGDTSRVPADLEQAMRDVSLTHVTAVSGGHFAVLSVAVLGTTSLLRLPRAVRAVVTAVVMAAFVVLVHPEPSVVRAAAMGALAVAGLLLGRPSRAVPALAASVVVLLLLDPWLARSFGFVLSVLATGAIVLLAPPLADRMARVVPRWLAVVVSVPVAAQAACAPVVVLLDPAVSVYAVPANLLAAPAVVPATLFGLMATVTGPWAPDLAALLAHGAGAATWWIAVVARVGAAMPGARLDWPGGAGGALGLAAATAVVLAVLLAPALVRVPSRSGRPGPRPAAVAVAVLVAVVAAVLVPVATPLRAGRPPSGWRVAMCDVGQGDSLVMRSGPRSAVVVDVGPDGGAADECLELLGISRIDLLVLSHHHADHVGGLNDVLSGREVVEALVSPVPEPVSGARTALAALADAGIPVRVGVQAEPGLESRAPPQVSARAASAGRAGEVRWTVLWPRPVGVEAVARALDHSWRPGDRTGEAEGTEANDASVVLLLQADDLAVLALGDLETAAQESLVAAMPTSAIRPDVVKVAHHGSARQSADLAHTLHAPVALVGAGAENDYGHPAPSAVALYESAGSLVLSTHECGTVTVGVVPDGPAQGATAAAGPSTAAAGSSGGSPASAPGRRLQVHARCLP